MIIKGGGDFMKKYQKLFMVSLVLGMTVIFLGYGTKEVSAKEVSTKEETTEVKNYLDRKSTRLNSSH